MLSRICIHSTWQQLSEGIVRDRLVPASSRAVPERHRLWQNWSPRAMGNILTPRLEEVCLYS